MSGNPLAGKVEVLGQTLTNIVYCLPGETTVLKAPGLWLDGKCEDRRTQEGPSLEKEEKIYNIIGGHPRIVKCLGLVDVVPGVIGLKLERATIGCVRSYILDHRDDPPPIGERLRMALEFAEGMAYLHKKDVIWHDASTRNALFFDDFHIKLCDFGASFVKGRLDFEADQGYDLLSELPLRGREEDEISVEAKELFALGSAIFEITEWKLPFDPIDDFEIINRMVSEDKLTPIPEDNPARDIIDGCWQERYGRAESIVEDLRAMAFVGACRP
ncbi:uncharacterized protein DNG_06172 [Cephalotrichum gorgonifer]|uniref:Protein kinase domain-containing protein n=1 Tax=Cephalotrichum gorgonifer TaxID=2041049 RepID=A0AAE8N163_9PEZI|nr:uncharacterized protein DNG_06172 [Cephalotrichum gorgonifer]